MTAPIQPASTPNVPLLTTAMVRRLIFCAWLILTFAALAGMFRLWYVREWTSYGRLHGDSMTRAILGRLGMDASLVDAAALIRAAWPPQTRYKYVGHDDHGSYLKYLILPRVPSDEGKVELFLGQEPDGFLTLNPSAPEWLRVSITLPSSAQPFMAPAPRTFPLSGLLLFTLCSLGLGYGCAVSIGAKNCLLPEYAILGFLVLVILHTVSHALCGTRAYGLFLGLGVGIVMGVGASRRHIQIAWSAIIRWPRQRVDRELLAKWALVLLVAAAIVWSFLMAVVVGPDEWDCWANWGAKAKLLALGDGGLPGMTRFCMADYPPFWPSLWSSAAWFCGGWEDRWVKGLGSLMLGLCVWELVATSYRTTRRLFPGLLLAAVLCSMPIVPLVASWGYAEPLLWLCTACLCSILAREDDFPLRTRLVLVGLFAFCCVSAKNEGAAVVLALGVWRAFCAARFRWFDTIVLTGCALLARLLWTAFVHQGNLTALWCDVGLSQSNNVIKECYETLVAIGHIWRDYRLWGGGPLLFITLLCFLRPVQGRYRFSFMLPSLFMLTASFAVVVLRPGDAMWKIGSAWGRVTIQAWIPALMFAIPLLSPPPAWFLRSDAISTLHRS